MPDSGTITTWHDDKGYGFITPTTGGGRVFVHIKAFQGRGRRPRQGDPVRFVAARDEQDRPFAKIASLAVVGSGSDPRRAADVVAFTVSGGFLAIAGALALIGKVPRLLFWVYALASLVAFTMYALDKSAARRNVWRTPESTLLLLSLVGGWPGALVAQRVLRHKSRKLFFQLMFWMTVLINVAAVIWILTPGGSEIIRDWLYSTLPLSENILRPPARS